MQRTHVLTQKLGFIPLQPILFCFWAPQNNCREKQSNILKHCKLMSILLISKLFFLLYTRIYNPLNLNALLTGGFSMFLL